MERLSARRVRLPDALPPVSIAASGALGAVAFGHALRTETAVLTTGLPEPALETLLLGVPALALCVAGYWLWTCDLAPAEVWAVGRDALVGGVVAVGSGVLLVGVTAVPIPDAESTFLLLVAIGTEGTLVGTLVGVAAATDALRSPGGRAAGRVDPAEETVTVLSHDLRNQLSVATGHLQLARSGADDDALRSVADAHDRMAALVEDCLVLAAREERTVETEPVSLASLARDCWAVVAPADARLVVETDAEVRADPARLDRLVENLLRNSVEHGSTSPRSQVREDAVEQGGDTQSSGRTAEGPPGDDPAVTVWVGATDDGFYVADDGPGIDSGAERRVFERGVSTRADGTGLGLSIVAAVAEDHGWTVTAGTSRAGGARFDVTGVETA